jgi:DNA-binding beta-propeller fold protein YncE
MRREYRFAATLVSLLLAGCSGALFAAPRSVPNAADGRYAPSWMAAGAPSNDLLYLSDRGRGEIFVYSYPQGKLTGTLSGFDGPEGECVDSAGNVWVADQLASELVEYEHGATTPKTTLGDPGFYPQGCAVDPASGDLAVADFNGFQGVGDLAIYRAGSRRPERFSDPDFESYYFCGYDNKGNLFTVGSGHGFSRFAVLRKGTRALKTVMFSPTLYRPTGVQWDGKYLAVGDVGYASGTAAIYRTNGTGGKVLKTTFLELDTLVELNSFWIQRNVIIAPDCCSHNVGFWKYPAGGQPLRLLSGHFLGFSAVISSHRSARL